MNELIRKTQGILKKIVEKNTADSILFSGGLDTSILAALNPKITAISISLENFSQDLRYAKFVEEKLGLRRYLKIITVDEALSAIPEAIKILKSFDPAIPNDLAVYFGLKAAKKMGLREIMTGDGADELFAGYNFMQSIDDLDKYIKKISKSMLFSTNKLGDYFGIKISQPYLDRELIDFTLSVPNEFKIRKENGRLHGKWLLRKAFEDILPDKIAWQNKRPLEYGSGMTKLREIISTKVSDKEFEEKKKVFPIKFLSKEHLYYYEIYRKEIGEIPKPLNGQKKCPGCCAGMKLDAFHCQVCGYVLDWRLP